MLNISDIFVFISNILFVFVLIFSLSSLFQNFFLIPVLSSMSLEFIYALSILLGPKHLKLLFNLSKSNINPCFFELTKKIHLSFSQIEKKLE